MCVTDGASRILSLKELPADERPDFLEHACTSDPQVRQELWALIDALRSRGATILMSTHYIEEAQRLADTVLIMSHGKAVAAGPPAHLVAEHAGREAVEVYGPPARLAEVALGHGVESYHIESERDIQPEWLVDARDVGITAGASTPDDVIERVIDDLAARGYSRPSAHTWQADLDLEYEPAY
jgi:ABC-type multidrug transport system ATPase subunit